MLNQSVKNSINFRYIVWLLQRYLLYLRLPCSLGTSTSYILLVRCLPVLQFEVLLAYLTKILLAYTGNQNRVYSF